MKELPEFNEENYLDSLLSTMEKSKDAAYENREQYLQELAQEEAANSKTEEELKKEELVEQVKKVVEKDVLADDIEEVDDSELEEVSPEMELDAKLSEVLEQEESYNTNDASAEDNTQLSSAEIENANVSIDTESGLTEEELERLAAMNLDEIISDATDGNMSIDDVLSEDEFDGEQSSASSEADSMIVEDETNTSSIDAMFGDSSGSSQSVSSTDETASDVQSNVNNAAGSDEVQNEVSKENSDDNKNADNDKKAVKAKKTKEGKKKGLLGVIKNIFFESLEDEVKAEEAIEGAASAATADATQQIADDIDSILDKAPTDENERVLQEVYGDKDKLEDMEAPKKGFFAKLKYKMAQRKKKNMEEDIAEQQAEEHEYEEKQKKKAEKKATKQAAAEKKAEEKKEAKANKPSKEKKPKEEKPKKEKKPKAPPKPGDILRIRPVSIILFVLFISGVILLIVILDNGLHYGISLDNAKNYISSSNYKKAYQQLAGAEVKDKDSETYDKAATVMYVQRQYESFENYLKMNMRTEALDALIKGIDRYNTYYNAAKEYGVASDLDSIKSNIIIALQNTFKISENDANALVTLSKENFTQYYYRVEAYGDRK